VRKSTLTSFVLSGSLFLGGALGGVALTAALAPGSALSMLIGLCTLPFAFLTGMGLWLVMALPSDIKGSFGRQGSGINPGAQSPARPGAIALLFTALGSSAIAGLALAFLSGWPAIVFLMILAGLVYGVTCWLLARAGWLAYPGRLEEEGP